VRVLGVNSGMKPVMAMVAAAVLAVGACSSPASTGSVPAASAAKLAAKLKGAGEPVKGLIVYTAKTDPNHLLGRQGGYTSKVAWVDPRAVKAGKSELPSHDPGGIEFGGGLEVFPDHSGAEARYEELKGFTAPFGDGYDYLIGDAVLRLSQYLTPSQAAAYKAAATRAAG
jgi:hypothetical protein